jgi:Glycoside-hydrolase family GH114
MAAVPARWAREVACGVVITGPRGEWLRARAGLFIVLAIALAVWLTYAVTGLTQSRDHLAVRADQPPHSAAATALPPPVRCASCWRPAASESWQIQLSSTPVRPFPRVGMIDVDGFGTPASTVAALHRTSRGRGVLCYIDAGTWENWRPDAGQFPRSLLGRNDGRWSGERWLDIAKFRGALARIMRARAQMCQRKGFNGIDFDNVDGYQNNTGFRLTSADQLRYDIFLANTAHSLGLSVALKNDVGQIPALIRYFDFAIDEQCFQYADCLASENGGRFGLNEFVAAHKAVFDIEYNQKLSRFCPAARRDRFNALLKHLNLGPWRRSCG